MKSIAEKAAGEAISKAVVTLPANFSKAWKRETHDACSFAGLEYIRMMSEPTAAAVAYRLIADESMFEDDANILVLDYGGGTLDVSVLAVSGDSIEVCSTAGDTFLGGRDFDEAIIGYCAT